MKILTLILALHACYTSWAFQFDDQFTYGCQGIDGECRCSTGNRCAYLFSLCDGYTDCEYGEDEPDTCPTIECGADEYLCPVGCTYKCIVNSKKCDSFSDCQDYSDEIDCSDEECQGFNCLYNGEQYCQPEEYRCDGILDCDDGSDETDCPEEEEEEEDLEAEDVAEVTAAEVPAAEVAVNNYPAANVDTGSYQYEPPEPPINYPIAPPKRSQYWKIGRKFASPRRKGYRKAKKSKKISSKKAKRTKRVRRPRKK